jgi:hypothetical protein
MISPNRATVAALLLLALPTLMASPARAADLPTGHWQTWRAYPASRIARPLVLPTGLIEPSITTAMTNLQAGGTGVGMGVAADVGLGARLQLGASLTLPLEPQASFGNFVLSLEAGVARALAVRIEAGVARSAGNLLVDLPADQVHNAVLVGLGLPFRLALHRMIALVSGSRSARALGLQPIVVQTTTADGQRSLFAFPSVIVSDNLFALAAQPDDERHGLDRTGTGVATALHLPLGVLFEPHERVSLSLTTGYRLVSVLVAQAPATHYHFVPLSFEAVVNAVPALDIGLRFDVMGAVATGGPSGYSLGAWGDARVLTLFVAGRL